MAFDFIIANKEFFIFILILSGILFLERKKLELQGSFPLFYVLLYKTSLGLDKMKKWSEKHPKTFLYLAYLSIFVGVIGMIAMFILMFWQLGFIVDNELSSGGGLVLPLKTEKGLDSAVPVFYVPFWYWFLALLILVVVHEFAHGVIAERFRIPIKSSGLAFFGLVLPFVPGAFVEPDEKVLTKKPWWQQIAVMGAGSTSNFLFGFLFILLIIILANPLMSATQDEQFVFLNTSNQSTLYTDYGITNGTIIKFDDSKENIFLRFQEINPNENHTLTLLENGEENTYKITTYEREDNSSKGMIGIIGIYSQYENKDNYKWLGDIPIYFKELLVWIALLNIGIGMMNLLPLGITDGGRIAKLVFENYFSSAIASSLYTLVSWVSLILIILTLWPSLLVSLLGLF